MTIAEFKAWLDGFEAAMSGAPTEEQWAKIKAKIGGLRNDGGEWLPRKMVEKPTPYWGETLVAR